MVVAIGGRNWSTHTPQENGYKTSPKDNNSWGWCAHEQKSIWLIGIDGGDDECLRVVWCGVLHFVWGSVVNLYVHSVSCALLQNAFYGKIVNLYELSCFFVCVFVGLFL